MKCRFCGSYLTKEDYPGIGVCFDCAHNALPVARTTKAKDPERAEKVREMRRAGVWKKH